MSLLHVVHGQSVTSAGAEVVSLKVIAMESIVLSSSISINCRTLVKVDAPGLYEWRKRRCSVYHCTWYGEAADDSVTPLTETRF